MILVHYMTLLNWNNNYSVNNEEFDKQHQILLFIINRLHDINVGRDAINSFKITIDELIFSSNFHFKSEQQYMKEIGYKDIDKHIAEHEYFKQRIIDFKDDDNSDDFELRHDLIVFLSEWILHHEIEQDKKINL